jgi:hypothetical protein
VGGQEMRVSIALPKKVPPSSYTPKEIFTTKNAKIKNILFKRLLDLHLIDYLAQKVYTKENSYFS